jgi:ABC-type multidrug transport system fused ATPase/permease subunit
MLDMSLRDNLKLGENTIPDENLINMLELVGMKEWFAVQRNGLNTLVGERGVKLSTGQRQRLNIIRGLLINKLV